MIRFHDITTADRALIQAFTMDGERQNCDLSFANLVSWRFLYNTQYAILDDYLVLRFYSGRHLAYMMPVPSPRLRTDGTSGAEPCDRGLASVIRAIRDDSIAMGHPFLMLGVCGRMRDVIERAFPDTFDIRPDRDFSDYIYLRERLATLAGKKLQAKRNHTNRFRTLYPDYEYRELTPALIPQCIALEKQWRRMSKGFGGNAGAEEQAGELSAELRSMTRAFNRWEELGLTGGTIWVEGRLVAFTFGCPINNSTFDVCVEKADVSYDGAFAVINQEFALRLPPQYVYINREEDLGDEGLRRSKLSYRPEMILEKNAVTEKHPLAMFEDQDRIKEETRELWRTVFADPEEFVDLYFSRVYKSAYNVCCQIDGHVAAALQTLPYPLLWHGTETPAAYISGVSTHPACRRQNVGANLMRQAHLSMYHHGTVLAALIPAEEWLYGWYGRMGYERVISCTPPPEGAAAMAFADFDRWQRSRSCILLHSEEALGVAQEDIRMAGDSWLPPAEPVQAMLRVVNAKKALDLWAARHAEADMVVRVRADADIAANNAYYIIRCGRVVQTDEPDDRARVMTIGELARFLFDGEGAEMTLMMN